MSKPVIELRHVTKTYGTSRGVIDLNFQVEKGQVFGFLGPNGAGKTTTIGMLIDLIRPSKGNALLFGLDSKQDSLEIRRRIGYLSGDMEMDGDLTGAQYIKYMANLRGHVDRGYIKELTGRMNSDLSRKIRTLSRGNQQKIGLIVALMHKPELLIFDEPTTGLDPLIQAEFSKLLLEHKKRGGTAFISSHILSEVQLWCDTVGFIREGQLITVRDLRELEKGLPKQVQVISTNKTLRERLEKLNGVSITSSQGKNIVFTYSGDINELITLLGNAKVDDVNIQDADLETVFMGYYQEKKSV